MRYFLTFLIVLPLLVTESKMFFKLFGFQFTNYYKSLPLASFHACSFECSRVAKCRGFSTKDKKCELASDLELTAGNSEDFIYTDSQAKVCSAMAEFSGFDLELVPGHFLRRFTTGVR